MDLELVALESNHTWDVVDIPPYANTIECRWVYKLKFLQMVRQISLRHT